MAAHVVGWMAAATSAHGLKRDDDFARAWSMGVSSERSLGLPKEWDGEDGGFDEFAYKYTNWLGGRLGGCAFEQTDVLLEHAANHTTPIPRATRTLDQNEMAKGVAMSMKCLDGAKALDIVRADDERTNDFEMWGRLWPEYRPGTSGRKMSLLKAVMEDKPKQGEDYATWYYRWLELVRQTEQARAKLLDDDIKCVVAMRRALK